MNFEQAFEQAMAWMKVHGKMIEEQSNAFDGWARQVSYRFTELLMDPHSVRAQQRLIDAVDRYRQVYPSMTVPPWKSPGQCVLNEIFREEDQRVLAELEAASVLAPPDKGDA